MREHNRTSFHIGLIVTSLSVLGLVCQTTVLADQNVTTVPSTPACTTLSATSTATIVSVATKLTQDIYQVDEVRKEVIPFHKVMRMSRDVQPGHMTQTSVGHEGLLEKTYHVTYNGATPIKYQLIMKKVMVKPVDGVVEAGYSTREARALPSRGGIYTRVHELDMVATGYSPYEGSSSGRCATGMRAGLGVVAVDPHVIPLGSKLYVQGYGYAVAGDTGGAIKGMRIDLGKNTYRAANAVGRKHVRVYVLSEGR